LSIFRTIDPEIRNSKLAEPGRMKLEWLLNTKNVSDTIENFTLPNQDGKQISLNDIKSKYILIDFWASWCTPCRKQSKAISQFYSDYNKEDFQIVGISVDKDKNKWLKAIKEDNVQWISLIDSKNVINDKLGVSSYPTSFLLNSDFEIIDMDLDSEKLRERLKQLLE
jgi:peroxiredoxin